MSISKSQAELLADGLLDDLGSAKEDLQPKETLSELISIAGELVSTAQNNLNRTKTNASGDLSDSLVIREPEVTGSTVAIDIEMNFYGRFINAGVKGTRSKQPASSPYSFKTEFPSRNHVEAIKEYMKKAKAKTRSSDVNKYGAYGGYEKKNVSISEASSAYAYARAIKREGIRRTGFLDNAVENTEQMIEERLGNALRIDVINAIDRQ